MIHKIRATYTLTNENIDTLKLLAAQKGSNASAILGELIETAATNSDVAGVGKCIRPILRELVEVLGRINMILANAELTDDEANSISAQQNFLHAELLNLQLLSELCINKTFTYKAYEKGMVNAAQLYFMKEQIKQEEAAKKNEKA